MLKKSNLALMSFSLMEDARNQFIDADTVVRIAKENGLSAMDIMDTEFRVIGEEALRAALKKYDVKCGCLISALPLYEESAFSVHNPPQVHGAADESVPLRCICQCCGYKCH